MIDIFYFEHSKVLINVLALTCMHSFVYIYIHVLVKFCDNQKIFETIQLYENEMKIQLYFYNNISS